MRRTVLAGAVALVAAGSGAAVVAAQGVPPTVTLTASARSVTVTGADGLKAGPTRIEMRSSAGERDLVLLEVKPGVTDAQLAEAAPKIESPADAREYGTFVAGGAVTPDAPYATTITLKAARYAVIDISRRPAFRGAFNAADPPSGIAAPAPAVTVGMDEFKFTGAKTLPRSGVVRFENTGEQLHHAIAFRLTRRANARRVIRTFRQGKEPRSGLAGATDLVGIADRGTVNDVEVKARAGRYLLVCFLDDERRPRGKSHVELGMIRQVRVR